MGTEQALGEATDLGSPGFDASNTITTTVSRGATTTAPFADRLIRRSDMLGTILIIVVILMLVGAMPRWSHSRGWGYYPSGGLGLVLVILIILLLLGRL